MTKNSSWLAAPVILALAGLLVPSGAQAQGTERTGKEVVEAVCAGCHAKGAGGAPRIGDKKAWSKRASQGLTSLTQHALKGMRAMPSHGGKLDLTDLEIGRAVAYMVNKSGGKWKEPASAKRSGICNLRQYAHHQSDCNRIRGCGESGGGDGLVGVGLRFDMEVDDVVHYFQQRSLVVERHELRAR